MIRTRRQMPRRSAGPAAPETCSLGGGRFEFLGFAEPAAPTLFSRFDYRPAGLPPMETLQEALYLPGQRCLHDADGARLDVSRPTYIEPDAPAWFNATKVAQVERLSMPLQIVPPLRAERISEPVLFLGQVHDHWGHFITDTLARLWALDEAPPGAKLLFAPDPAERMTPLVSALLEAAGVTPDRILRPHGPALFAQLYCPVQSLQLSRIYQCFEDVHRRIAGRLLGSSGPAPPDRPVYLTRSRLGDGLRRLIGEDELEQRLQREGYDIVSPERLGLAEQMAIFNGEHPVVGAFGSAMHTVLFRKADAGQRLATLFPEKIPPRFMMVDAVKRSEASYINCIHIEAPDGSRWRLDPEAAMQRLDAAGLLGVASV